MNEVPAPQMSKHTTMLVNEVSAKKRARPATTFKAKQQLIAKEVFSPQIIKFRSERKVPLYKDETWSADLIDESSLSKYNENCKVFLTVIDVFTKYAWAILLKIKSGVSITNGFKLILSEGRKPEKLRVERGSEFYNKTFECLFKEYRAELYSTCSDLNSAIIERFNKKLLHIISKPMFINGHRNWANPIKEAVVTYNNKKHTAMKMIPVDASNHPEKVKPS